MNATTHHIPILPLIFAMSSFGTMLGLWVSWSASPIAITALPLVFGLVGGTGGYWIMKANIDTISTANKANLWAASFGSLCISCLLATLIFTTIKFFILRDNDREPVDFTTLKHPIDAVILSSKLRALGTSDNVTKHIVSDQDNDLTPISNSDLVILKDATSKYVGAYKHLGDEQRKALELKTISLTLFIQFGAFLDFNQ